ncbi:UNVERIFIED_CONTAM: hypothetical protein K2H54_032969 [Gekko kuhli]
MAVKRVQSGLLADEREQDCVSSVGQCWGRGGGGDALPEHAGVQILRAGGHSSGSWCRLVRPLPVSLPHHWVLLSHLAAVLWQPLSLHLYFRMPSSKGAGSPSPVGSAQP